MTVRRFFSYASLVFGAVNILNFWAPRPVPTVGLSAFLVGGVFIGLGLILRSPPGSRINWLGLINLLKTKPRPGLETESDRLPAQAARANGQKLATDRLLAVRVLKLASEQAGRLTIAQTAIELSVPLDEAEMALDECLAKGAAFFDVDERTGLASYRFPEFLKPETPIKP